MTERMTPQEGEALVARRDAIAQRYQETMVAYQRANGEEKAALKERMQELQLELAQLKPQLRAWGEQCHEHDQGGVPQSKRELVGRLLRWRDELRDRVRNPKAPEAERHFADVAARRLDLILGPLQVPPASSAAPKVVPPRADPPPAPAVPPAPPIQWKPTTVTLNGAHCGVTVSLTAEETRDYQTGDPVAVVCRKLGVTVAEYEAWDASAGYVSCCARTRAGKRCKALVPNAGTTSLVDWVQRMRVGELCAVHG